MKLFRITLQTRTAFATAFKGDTLFGQSCWAIRNLWGESRLLEQLTGYTEGRPYLVFSDPLPSGFIHRPSVPLDRLGISLTDPKARKAVKAQVWLPESVLVQPVNQWGSQGLDKAGMMSCFGLKGDWCRHENRTHNSLNRLTGSTGAGEAGFAPYDRALNWYHPDLPLVVYAALDEQRLEPEELHDILAYVGHQGYGKEASSGLGKFDVTEIRPWQPPQPPGADAWLTLAPMAPQGLPWVAENSYYSTFTRFGRHGDRAVHSGQPFKNPVLLADSFALLTPAEFKPEACVTGQGLSGVSRAIATTVQQAYAPVFAVNSGRPQ